MMHSHAGRGPRAFGFQNRVDLALGRDPHHRVTAATRCEDCSVCIHCQTSQIGKRILWIIVRIIHVAIFKFDGVNKRGERAIHFQL